jgi:hypothetical protein
MLREEYPVSNLAGLFDSVKANRRPETRISPECNMLELFILA